MTARYADFKFRPIDTWPGELTARRRRAQFSAAWRRTVELLDRELTNLDARNVVVQVDVAERDIRIDGKLKANARPGHPGLVLAFDSKFGPLKYAVDTYDRFEDNVRALALALEALRAVDRYGVTKRGEQYTGWKALPAATDPADAIQTREQAHDYLSQRWDGDVKRALRETHPDRGGDPDEFRRVVRAKEFVT